MKSTLKNLAMWATMAMFAAACSTGGGSAQSEMGHASEKESPGDLILVTENSMSYASPRQIVRVPASGGVPVVVTTEIGDPQNLAVGKNGDIYVTDSSAQGVFKIPADGGPISNIGSDWNAPFGIAVNDAGDVFVSDQAVGGVVKVPADGSPQSVVLEKNGSTGNIALNTAGDLFATLRFPPYGVVRVPADGSPNEQIITDVASPVGLALSPAGEIFVSDDYNKYVSKVSGGDSRSTRIKEKIRETGITVDLSGNLYLANGSEIVKISPDGTEEVLDIPGLKGASFIAFAPSGG